MSGTLQHQPFGSRADRTAKARVLRAALAALGPERPYAAFDLDSTILMNKVRQARIVREYGAAHGDARLAACPPEAVVSWDLRDTARLCGLSDDEAERAFAPMKEFWRHRFFTSEYCRDDTPVAGAREFLEQVQKAGGEILYITGRHVEMGAGTIESFRRAGFPLPDGERVQLWLKPKLADDDDAWKEICHRRMGGAGFAGDGRSPKGRSIGEGAGFAGDGRSPKGAALVATLRGLACAFDNEPLHVNAYKRAFPDAVVVHLDTDHSRRPVEVLAEIPSIHDFAL